MGTSKATWRDLRDKKGKAEGIPTQYWRDSC